MGDGKEILDAAAAVPVWYPALGIAFAIVSSINMNVGKGVQKWKVHIFGHGRDLFKREHRKDLRLWIFGLLLTASAAPLFSAALKLTDKTSLVSSLNGVGLIGLVIFAMLVLKERVGRQEAAGAALVVLGTGITNYFDVSGAGQTEFDLLNFAMVTGGLVVLFGVLAVISWRIRRFHGLVFGTLAGIFLGTALMLGDIALVESGNDMLGQLKTPYPYAAFGAAIAALTTTQFAFWRSRAMEVVPTINSVFILSPLLVEYLTFGTTLRAVQYAGIGVIVVGVVLLTYTEAQDRIEGTAD